MINSLVLLAGMVWFLWKFFSEKNSRHLYISIFLATLFLTRWPLFLPMKLAFSIDAFAAAGFLIYENPYKKGLKNSSSMAYIYILLFFLFGLLFFGEGWLVLCHFQFWGLG